MTYFANVGCVPQGTWMSQACSSELLIFQFKPFEQHMSLPIGFISFSIVASFGTFPLARQCFLSYFVFKEIVL